MKNKFLFFPLLCVFLSGINSSQASTQMNRFRNVEDRFKTEEELRPLGHDFLIDISAAMSKEIMDIVDEAEKASKTSGTDAEKIAAITAFLRKYNGTEQFGHAKVTAGIPLPSFTIFGTKIIPDLRASGSLGAAVTLKTAPLAGTYINLSDIPGIPAGVTALLPGFTVPLSLSTGTDLVQYAVNQGRITSAQAEPYLRQYYMPDFSLPNIFVYAKNDFKYTLGIQYILSEHWFGHLNIFNMHRTDKEVRITEQVLKRDYKIADLKNKNTQSTLNVDYRLGYKDDHYSAAFTIEDIKLSTLSDKKATAGDVVYQYDPLFRLHMDALYRLSVFKLSPFLGIHKRKGYSASNGWYLGGEGAVTVWGDRLFLALRTMMDKEYLTFTPSLRLWFLQAEYSFRKVLDDTTPDGNRTSNIHSANFRIFF